MKTFVPITGSTGRVAVTRLTLTEFRCYRSLRLTMDARPVVVTGPNGAGKTNLLEALSFLSPGRGLRRARLDEIGRRTADGDSDADTDAVVAWAVSASVAVGDDTTEIGTGLTAGVARRRVVRIDGAEARSQAALGERISATWLTPEMDRLFIEGRSERRRFLDRLVFGFDAAHAERLGEYERAMRERARLLRDGRAGGGADGVWLAALEDRMARAGVAVAAARADFVARLDAACALGIGPFPAASLAVEGEVEDWLATVPAIDAEERCRESLATARRRDGEAGRAGFGVHLSDLACRHVAKDTPARDCSTGEQKALLIGIVLANARLQSLERGLAPLLLFDEVAAHLDGERRAALFEEICAAGAQAWLTGTDAEVFAPFGERAQYFGVSDAVVTRAA